MDRTKIKGLIIYRGFRYQALFEKMELLLGGGGQEEDACSCADQLIELAVAYGFEGNLYHCFLAFCLASHETAYSTSCEIKGAAGGSLDSLARHDFLIFKELFDRDIRRLDGGDRTGIWQILADYRAAKESSRVFNKRIRDRIVELAASLERAEDAEHFQAEVVQFYKEFGVGKFGLNKAFRILEKEEGGYLAGQGGTRICRIEPITSIEHIALEDLVGYELQKKKLVENTEAFIEGRQANNCLLYGDAGTGKSSCIKAILNQYYDRYEVPLFIVENGFGYEDVLEDGQIHDRNRIEYLGDHIREMVKAVEEDGVDLLGYTVWGCIDPVSFTTGEMRKRYGFIYVDKKDDGSGTYERVRKDSFYWYQDVIEKNGQI